MPFLRVDELSEHQRTLMRHALNDAFNERDALEEDSTRIVQWDDRNNEPVVLSLGPGLKVRDSIGHEKAGLLPDVRSKWQQYVRFSGLHPGAQILADDLGAMTCILTDDGDRPTHLLTAGHLFRERARRGTPVKAAKSRTDPEVVIGVLLRNFLDDPPDKDNHGLNGGLLDIALVKLNDAGRSMARSSRGHGPQLSGYYSHDGIHGNRGRVYLTMRGKRSDSVRLSLNWSQSYEIDTHPMLQGTGIREPYTLRGLISSDKITQGGDSGTILYEDTDHEPSAIGACVGAGDQSLFVPISLALGAASQVDGCKDIEVWS